MQKGIRDFLLIQDNNPKSAFADLGLKNEEAAAANLIFCKAADLEDNI